MALDVPQQVKDLKSFAELLSWAMATWGGTDGGLLGIVKRTATGATADVTLVKGTDEIEFSFGDLPSSVHAQWFLRVGLMLNNGALTRPSPSDEKLKIDTKMAGYKSAGSAKDWYWGTTLGGTYFGYFCEALRLPEEIKVYLRDRYAGFEFRKRPRRFARIVFDKDRVQAAVESSSELLEAHPPVDCPTGKPTGATPTLKAADHGVPPDGGRLRVTLGSAYKSAVVSSKGPVLGLKGPDAMIASSGAALAAQTGATLRVSRLNRVTGRAVAWIHTLDLTSLGDGEVLAVDSLGPADIVFAWASDSGTAIYRGHHADGSVELMESLVDDRASQAVLHGVRALFAFPAKQAGAGTCEAFPELTLTSMVGAASNGRLVVLAIGADRDGHESACIEVNGRYSQLVPVGARLELPLGTRSFPAVRGADGTPIELSPQPTTAWPYEHWISPLLIGQAAPA